MPEFWNVFEMLKNANNLQILKAIPYISEDTENTHYLQTYDVSNGES